MRGQFYAVHGNGVQLGIEVVDGLSCRRAKPLVDFIARTGYGNVNGNVNVNVNVNKVYKGT